MAQVHRNEFEFKQAMEHCHEQQACWRRLFQEMYNNQNEMKWATVQYVGNTRKMINLHKDKPWPEARRR